MSCYFILNLIYILIFDYQLVLNNYFYHGELLVGLYFWGEYSLFVFFTFLLILFFLTYSNQRLSKSCLSNYRQELKIIKDSGLKIGLLPLYFSILVINIFSLFLAHLIFFSFSDYFLLFSTRYFMDFYLLSFLFISALFCSFLVALLYYRSQKTIS